MPSGFKKGGGGGLFLNREKFLQAEWAGEWEEQPK